MKLNSVRLAVDLFLFVQGFCKINCRGKKRRLDIHDNVTNAQEFLSQFVLFQFSSASLYHHELSINFHFEHVLPARQQLTPAAKTCTAAKISYNSNGNEQQQHSSTLTPVD